MRIKQAVILIAVSGGVSGCGPSATVLPPAADLFPSAEEALLDLENCPDADPDGEGVLHDPVDGSTSAVLEARRNDGEMYVLCRSAAHGLIEHERERILNIRERSMSQ